MCVSSKPPSSTPPSWYFVTQNKTKRIPFKGNILTLPLLSPSETGMYVCHGTYKHKICAGPIIDTYFCAEETQLIKSFFTRTELVVFCKLLNHSLLDFVKL